MPIHILNIIKILIYRSFWRTVLLPSWHQPEGDGLIFHTVHDYAIASAPSIYSNDDEWP